MSDQAGDPFGGMPKLDAGTLARLLEEGGRFLLYKHSFACGVAQWSWENVQAFRAKGPDIPVYWLDVIAQRELAREVARLLDVPHASPQAILVEDGVAVWDASHMGVRADLLERAVVGG